MTKSKAFFVGLLAGLIAGVAMTVAMLVLACLGVATPLAIIGDRLSVFIKPGPFLSIMGRVGGYNHLKQLGVGSTMAGQLLVSTLGGAIFTAPRHNLDDVDLCGAADNRGGDCVVARARHELHRFADRIRRRGYADRVRAQRLGF
jgi:hypothetical protein